MQTTHQRNRFTAPVRNILKIKMPIAKIITCYEHNCSTKRMSIVEGYHLVQNWLV